MSATHGKRPRVLLIGPRPQPGAPIGGAQVSFSELCASFGRSGEFAIDVVDTTRASSHSGRLRRRLGEAAGLVRTVLAVLRRGRAADVVLFNASTTGVMKAGSWLLRATRWVRRPLVVRVFGGSLDLAFDRVSTRRRERMLRTMRGAALVLLQTDQLCARFAGCGVVRKLPTTRRVDPGTRARRGDCRRFVFMSQLRPEKGYEEALRAIELCPADCTLDIYGPSLPTTDLMRLRSHPRAVYHGALPREHVGRVLRGHDALVFPSYYEGEGLPGVIVEALQCGLPVIATRWRSLPELIADGENGLLVPPKSAPYLAVAMRRLALDSAFYTELCIGAAERGRELDASTWQRRLESWLREACGIDARSPHSHAAEREPSQ